MLPHCVSYWKQRTLHVTRDFSATEVILVVLTLCVCVFLLLSWSNRNITQTWIFGVGVKLKESYAKVKGHSSKVTVTRSNFISWYFCDDNVASLRRFTTVILGAACLQREEEVMFHCIHYMYARATILSVSKCNASSSYIYPLHMTLSIS